MKYTRDRAVSPVVAVILLVAVTVTLSAVIGGFALNLGQQTTSNTNQQSVGVSTSQSDGQYTATIVTGSAEEAKLLVNGTEVDNISNPSAGDTLSANTSPGERVTVVTVTSGSESVVTSQVISSETVSDEPVVLASEDFAGNTYNSTVWRKDDASYEVWQDPPNSEFTSGEWRVDGTEVSGNLVYDSAVPDAGVALETEFTYRSATTDGGIWMECYTNGSASTGAQVFISHYTGKIYISNAETGNQYNTSYSGPWLTTWRAEFRPNAGVTVYANGTEVMSESFSYPTRNNECVFMMSTGQGGVTLHQDNLTVETLP